MVNFIRIYPTHDGITNTMWCLYPNDGARCCSVQWVGIGPRFCVR